MALTLSDINKYLYIIFSGKRFAFVDDVMYEFIFPTSETLQKGQLIYEKAFNEATSIGILPEKELTNLVNSKKLITSEDELKLRKLEGQLEAQKVLLTKTTRVKARQDRIIGNIKRLKSEIDTILFKKQSKFLMSAENKAEEIRNFYLCSKCSYRCTDSNLVWPTYEAAMKEKNFSFKDEVLINFIKLFNGIPVKIIREIARSGIWRIRFVTSMKTAESLFGRPTIEYTTDQLNLAYWSNFYQNIYEMLPEDRPSDLIIDDDDALDAYMDAYYKEKSRTSLAKRDSKQRGRLSAFGAEEVIVTRAHELYEDIEYDQPKEAQKFKDRIDLKKRTRRG